MLCVGSILNLTLYSSSINISDNPPNTPGECTYYDWSDYGPCTVTCGDGLRYRTRRLKSINTGGERVFCKDDLIQSKPCGDPCSEPGKYIAHKKKISRGWESIDN